MITLRIKYITCEFQRAEVIPNLGCMLESPRSLYICKTWASFFENSSSSSLDNYNLPIEFELNYEKVSNERLERILYAANSQICPENKLY